jgi:hypothetical protein
MKIPGFTSENSAYRSTTAYQSASRWGSGSSPGVHAAWCPCPPTRFCIGNKNSPTQCSLYEVTCGCETFDLGPCSGCRPLA